MATTHRFEGNSIEDALSAAAEALGPSLQVTDARRIREGGVMGFFSKERFEVVAEGDPVTAAAPQATEPSIEARIAAAAERADATAPAPPAVTPPATFTNMPSTLDDTLRALVEDVESREGGGDLGEAESFAGALAAADQRAAAQRDGVETMGGAVTAGQRQGPAMGNAHPTTGAAQVDTSGLTSDMAQEPPRPEKDDIDALIDRAGSAIAAIRAGMGAPVDDDPTITDAILSDEPETGAPRPATAVPGTALAPAPQPISAAPAPAVIGLGEPAWSRTALEQLGLPTAILSHLPVLDPDSDLEWTAALGRAIAAEVRPPVTAPGPHAPVAASGFGAGSAVDLLLAATAGVALGTITIGETAKPATATELALAIRELLARS